MERGFIPGEQGWARWKDIAQTESLYFQPSPTNRGFASTDRRQRLPPLPPMDLIVVERQSRSMPGDEGWVQWMRIGCSPPRSGPKRLPSLRWKDL